MDTSSTHNNPLKFVPATMYVASDARRLAER